MEKEEENLDSNKTGEQKSSSVNTNEEFQKNSPSKWSQVEEDKLKEVSGEISKYKNKIDEINQIIKALEPAQKDKSGEIVYSEKEIEKYLSGFIQNIKSIKKVENLEVKGKRDFIEISVYIEAEGKILGITKKVKGTVNIVFGNQEDGISVRDHKVIGGNDILINSKLKPELPKIPTYLKEFIENKEKNYLKKIYIENGLLRAQFIDQEKKVDSSETEKLEQEKKILESVLEEKRKAKEALLLKKDESETDKGENQPVEKFEIDKYFEIPKINRIQEALKDKSFEEIAELKNKKDILSPEELTTWNDVEIMLDHPEELVDMISELEEMLKKTNTPKSKKWANECIAIFLKILDLKEVEKVITGVKKVPTSETKEEEEKNTEEESEKSEIHKEEHIEHIPIVEESQEFRKIIVGEEYLEKEIENEFNNFLHYKGIIAKEGKMVKIKTTEEGWGVNINIKERPGLRDLKWHIGAILKNTGAGIEMTDFKYNKEDSHSLRQAIETNLKITINKICTNLINNHSRDLKPKSFDIVIKGDKLELNIEK